MATPSEKQTMNMAEAVFREFSRPSACPKSLVMYDVEMVNKAEYSCTVRVFARTSVEAQKLAGQRFPELAVTGLTVEVLP